MGVRVLRVSPVVRLVAVVNGPESTAEVWVPLPADEPYRDHVGEQPAVARTGDADLPGERAALLAEIAATELGMGDWPVEMQAGLRRLNDARRRQLAVVEASLTAAGVPLEEAGS